MTNSTMPNNFSYMNDVQISVPGIADVGVLHGDGDVLRTPPRCLEGARKKFQMIFGQNIWDFLDTVKGYFLVHFLAIYLAYNGCECNGTDNYQFDGPPITFLHPKSCSCQHMRTPMVRGRRRVLTSLHQVAPVGGQVWSQYYSVCFFGKKNHGLSLEGK